MVMMPCATLSGSPRRSVAAVSGVFGNDLVGVDAQRPFSLDRNVGTAIGGNARTTWTGEFCGTNVTTTIDSIQVTTYKPHAAPGTSPGVLT